MQLLLIRHAIAEDREEWAEGGRPDAERPLTDKGRSRMRQAAEGLAGLVERPDVVATSPYARAAQTAEIVVKALGAEKAIEVGGLVPGADFADLVTWLRSLGLRNLVVVVGHEPHLSGFVSYMLTGRRESFLEFKKGGACLLQLADPPTPGVALLKWHLSPGQMRRME